jgi:hypothetical protein
MKPCRIIALLFVLTMCTSNTEVYMTTFHKQYQNGKSIEVIREDKITNRKGIITGLNYGTTNTFHYSFSVEPDEDLWEGAMNQVPLALVFCDDDTYLKVTERILKYDSLYGPSHLKDTTLYFKNEDNRYFFKLFGEQHFQPSDSIEYLKMSSACVESSVPVL